MWEDPIVSEVPRVREDLAARFNFDISTIFEDIRRRQIKLGSRLIRHKKHEKAEKAAAPDRDFSPLHRGR